MHAARLQSSLLSPAKSVFSNLAHGAGPWQAVGADFSRGPQAFLVSRERSSQTFARLPLARMSKLKAQGLKKSYQSRTVVRDVSLDVSSGEVIGLLGPNGAGKTTCFYMMVGLVPVDQGSIFLDGAELTRLPIHSRARLGLSYLPQEPSI